MQKYNFFVKDEKKLYKNPIFLLKKSYPSD